MIEYENITYELKLTANGMPNYYADGERVKGKTLPEGIRERLNEDQTVDPTTQIVNDEPKPITDILCIFCQEPATSGKTLNSKFVPLCRNDYLAKSLGKVAQKVRELNGTTST